MVQAKTAKGRNLLCAIAARFREGRRVAVRHLDDLDALIALHAQQFPCRYQEKPDSDHQCAHRGNQYRPRERARFRDSLSRRFFHRNVPTQCAGYIALEI